ncbi:MAG: hypothetical protein NT013_01180 [Planctomycetia bacterium]|nr:hypothetical protein [Planctomycetia bacterium]
MPVSEVAMFLPIPMRVTSGRQTGVAQLPFANVALIMLNVVAYFLLSPFTWAVGP